ncbi:hypothetical protein AVEN_141318-1 [Araneus ventricosus]|uniref:Uncharacterized protein n=1 Tax=Araneus ventricosus TaxID=182803 RepID=A0A4Y2KXI1_ARAVE|nr:hypothetical protein AVEN_141318-1 [Araneus ventricosus]
MSIRGFTSKVKVHDELIPINSDTIFRKISLLKRSDAEFQKYFEFELAPFPLSLFDEGGLQQAKAYKYVCVKFQKESLVVEQAEENADYLLIKSALEIEKRSQCVLVVAEDIDLLVIMAASTNSENIFFLKLRRGKAEEALYFAATLNIAPHIRDNILFLPAFSDCDTTSALFMLGKKKFINVLNFNKL